MDLVSFLMGRSVRGTALAVLLVAAPTKPATAQVLLANIHNADNSAFPPSSYARTCQVHPNGQGQHCSPYFPLVEGQITVSYVNNLRVESGGSWPLVEFGQYPYWAPGVTCNPQQTLCEGTFEVDMWANRGGLRGTVRDTLGRAVDSGVAVTAYAHGFGYQETTTTRYDGTYDFADRCTGWQYAQMC